MLSFLFRGLTTERRSGQLLFDSATNIAREPHWYVEGQVPDTLDGRFAVLATIIALVMVRLEREGNRANVASVALTERFIEVMESEHRELGFGDPTLGKTVRKLVGMLARRTKQWREAVADPNKWNEAARNSLYKDKIGADALSHSAKALRRFNDILGKASFAQIEQGKIA
ncbi:MAG TPA: ubiquinol-cytochrome C chaperone family protein [Sphingomicrobium sp.]|nr:ubiquinol-cytochrome C chaperone family protein [Sphingomicrobium sp.]